MSAREEIGLETPDDRDQFFRIEEGSGEIWIDGVKSNVKSDDAMIVPAGAAHNLINTGDAPLRVYTLYRPPEHRDGVIHATKEDALRNEEHFDGKTPE
jgi:mannose-6-phosphate isomerase-like protein (cupin superfamily)